MHLFMVSLLEAHGTIWWSFIWYFDWIIKSYGLFAKTLVEEVICSDEVK